jgi:hypothetical protein
MNVMPVTVTTTVTVSGVQTEGGVMFERYFGGGQYIMSNEFSLTIHKNYL